LYVEIRRSNTIKNLRGRGPESQGPRTNYQIRADKIRVIDEAGEMLGVMNVKDAVEIAEGRGLDLIEISPNADPPVCKMLDSGKYKYEQQKKKAAAKKNQKVVEIKEIKLRPVTGENDYQVKLRNIRRFLEDGNKVKVTLRFRGREIAHKELGERMLLRIAEDVVDIGKPEFFPKMEGRQLLMILVSIKATA